MDIVCFCHLRWNFVYQRPQHLLSRFARHSRVFVFEEPIFDAASPILKTTESKEGVVVLTPHLPVGLSNHEVIQKQQSLLDIFFKKHNITKYIAWYYTPLMTDIGTAMPEPQMVVYDCMDELSAFKGAHPDISTKESLLFQMADLVFTGGYSLYEAKKGLHSNVFPFPSSIDKQHFSRAREQHADPEDQSRIRQPRIGFFGVIDERLDIALIERTAELKPEWQFIFIGPTVKIDPQSLPALPNIHYLGPKSYEELPVYLSGWDVAMIPFAMNESTRFISPTKTPEYLAGNIPVVSTPIRDVVTPYGEERLVYIAATAEQFVDGIEWGLSRREDKEWMENVDLFLKDMSWDNTWKKMEDLIREKIRIKQMPNPINENEYV